MGKIKQTPPKRSRVKREEREREIFEFNILKKEGKNFEFLVSCQAGTYIRKLIDDLGKEMNIGAHMASLHRTMQGPFSDKESIKVEDLKDGKKLEKSLKLLKLMANINLKYYQPMVTLSWVAKILTQELLSFWPPSLKKKVA